jgi:hypothetical protein
MVLPLPAISLPSASGPDREVRDGNPRYLVSEPRHPPTHYLTTTSFISSPLRSTLML